MKIDVLNWRAVAVWRWKVDEESCGICCQPFDGCCPACVSPGSLSRPHRSVLDLIGCCRRRLSTCLGRMQPHVPHPLYSGILPSRYC